MNPMPKLSGPLTSLKLLSSPVWHRIAVGLVPQTPSDSNNAVAGGLPDADPLPDQAEGAAGGPWLEKTAGEDLRAASLLRSRETVVLDSGEAGVRKTA